MVLYFASFQVFDAFIVISSFILDVIFLDSRWYETGKDATTILVLLLPWRVVRIVNSKWNFPENFAQYGAQVAQFV